MRTRWRQSRWDRALGADFHPPAPIEFLAAMDRLAIGFTENAAPAELMARSAVGRPKREACILVIAFLDSLMATKPDYEMLRKVWFASPAEALPPSADIGQADEKSLRLFFDEMRRLYAERLARIDSWKK